MPVLLSVLAVSSSPVAWSLWMTTGQPALPAVEPASPTSASTTAPAANAPSPGPGTHPTTVPSVAPAPGSTNPGVSMHVHYPPAAPATQAPPAGSSVDPEPRPTDSDPNSPKPDNEGPSQDTHESDETTRPYVLGGSDTAWGGFGGLHVKPSSLGGRAGLFVGGGGGLFVRTAHLGVNVGVAGYGLTVSSTRIDDGSGERRHVDLSYGGLTLGLGYVAPRFFELGAKTLVGVGSVCAFGSTMAASEDADASRCTLAGAVLVVEPEAVAYIRFSEHFRLVLAAGYRFTLPPWENPRARELSGVGGTVGFEWGTF
ncbi:MAG: hypothetical protein B7733_00250 [Myxococcales bacterium FL481]|nr:MAG: hypothetical protein B7733_00250 [Myxococcales bacterium FL481]